MEEVGVIEKVECSSNWLSGLVIAEKMNSWRVCIDPRPLSRALKWLIYSLPTTDDNVACLPKAGVFVVCDVKNGIWYVPLDSESTQLMASSTLFSQFHEIQPAYGVQHPVQSISMALPSIWYILCPSAFSE